MSTLLQGIHAVTGDITAHFALASASQIAIEAGAATTGIAGALMLATKCRIAHWAWPVWIVSGVAWIAYCLHTQAYFMLLQQVVFIVINVLGTWTWVLKPSLALARMRAHSRLPIGISK